MPSHSSLISHNSSPLIPHNSSHALVPRLPPLISLLRHRHLPLLLREDGAVVRVPDADLPVLLPDMEDFTPSPDGSAPLARATDWVRTTDPETGLPARRVTDTPGSSIGAYLGLVPGEDSSGEKQRRGRITRTGNALVRRLLVETAWHYQHRPSVGVALGRRRKGQPARVIAIADKAQQRLCRRFRKLAAEHKPAPKIAVAIARELAGFLWAALQPAGAR